jgi:hypothetical protein
MATSADREVFFNWGKPAGLPYQTSVTLDPIWGNVSGGLSSFAGASAGQGLRPGEGRR